MSLTAPWFAMACDWSDSEMFDDSTFGVRLAWVELLSVTKAQGRAGRVTLKISKFVRDKRLSVDAVEEMLVRATRAGAVRRQGDVVTLMNWRGYQDPRVRSNGSEGSKQDKDLDTNGARFTETTGNDATKDPPPITPSQPPCTMHQGESGPPPKTPKRRKGNPMSRFVKPTLEEVAAYCLERKNGVDPQRFVNFYESKGWKVGSEPMKNWKACVHTWESREDRSNGTHRTPPRPRSSVDPSAFGDDDQ